MAGAVKERGFVLRKVLIYIGKLLSFVVVVLALVTFWPQITRWLGGVAEGPRVVETTRMTHELREMGVLTSQSYTDTGVFVSSVPAIIIGEAQRVTVPYEYRIDYGIDLEKATIEAVDDGLLAVALPQAEMVHDALRVTGEVEVKDFLYRLTEARYQEILDQQTETFREEYLADASYAEAALVTAQSKVRALLEALLEAQGASDTWSIVFTGEEA